MILAKQLYSVKYERKAYFWNDELSIIDNYDNDNSETESGTSEEYDGFEEFEITAEKENKIWDDKLIQGLRLLHVKVLHSISDEAFNKISNQLEQCSKPLTTN
ncbi:hypothetical protein GLOIN_2v1825428 [Rhizophagus irregularis DAOM 181602=DAOM 197198]|nr:hypothetical protein GLOIN_2v1825428 [Rhizophagus irregularis DAOM 181602=DAOM 197198]